MSAKNVIKLLRIYQIWEDIQEKLKHWRNTHQPPQKSQEIFRVGFYLIPVVSVLLIMYSQSMSEEKWFALMQIIYFLVDQNQIL